MPPAVENPLTAAGDAAATKRLKKREIDRRCQREARQRTKSRIAYLEGLVEELHRKDTSGQVTALMQQVADVRKERDMFARTLRGIEDSIRSHRSVLQGLPRKQEPIPSVQATRPPVDAREQTHPEGESPASMKSMPETVEAEVGNGMGAVNAAAPPNAFDRAQPACRSTNSTEAGQRSHGITGIASSEPECDCCGYLTPEDSSLVLPTQPDRKSMWRFAHAVLDEPPMVSPKILRWEDEHSDDIPVRAVIDGWPAVISALGGQLPPLWAKLRRIDEAIFGNLDRIERLAILYVMHLLLRHHAEPLSSEARQRVPPWYLARPSQALSHSYALDFFTWPGTRERLIFSQHSYCSNLFWSVHNAGLKLLWQYDLRDCYSVNVQKGAYQLSRAFEERVTDINAWTMGPEFFQRWPEFYGDIPSLETISTPMNRLMPVSNVNAKRRQSPVLGMRINGMGGTIGEGKFENPDRRAHQRVHAAVSPTQSSPMLQPESWKTPFMERSMAEQDAYLPLSQESYLPMLSTSQNRAWDSRSQGTLPEQDWLWLSGGLDTGLSETGG